MLIIGHDKDAAFFKETIGHRIKEDGILEWAEDCIRPLMYHY